MLCLVLYLALAVGVYGYWLGDWGAVRAIYFATVTMTVRNCAHASSIVI